MAVAVEVVVAAGIRGGITIAGVLITTAMLVNETGTEVAGFGSKGGSDTYSKGRKH